MIPTPGRPSATTTASALRASCAEATWRRGPRWRRFERGLAERMGVAAAAAVSSGSAALELALRALDVGPGTR